MRDLLSLLSVAVENSRYRHALRAHEQAVLGGRSWYRALDRALLRAYRWSDPFALSRWAKRSLVQPRQDLVFGETPIGTAWEILSRLEVDQADHVVELGSGRAILSLVAVSAFGSSATAIELVPAFVTKTRQVADRLGLKRLKVKQADFLAHSLPEGTVYFLTATTFSDASWRTIDDKLAGVAEGTRAVSLSAPLSREFWTTEQEVKLPFSWGDNTVYFQKRRPTGSSGSGPK